MLRKEVTNALLEQRFINVPADINETFPQDSEDILLIVDELVIKGEVDRRNFNNGRGCCLRFPANKGFEAWVLNYSIGDEIEFKRIYNASGVVRVLIVNN